MGLIGRNTHLRKVGVEAPALTIISQVRIVAAARRNSTRISHIFNKGL